MLTLRENKHLILAIAINLLLIGLLIKAVWDSSDKALVLLTILYPLLILVNATVWIVLGTLRNQSSGVYKITTVGSIVLYLPILILAMLY
jgi:hypothetical protein